MKRSKRSVKKQNWIVWAVVAFVLLVVLPIADVPVYPLIGALFEIAFELSKVVLELFRTALSLEYQPQSF